MAWNDLTNPEAWKLALANLLRKGEDVGTYISEAPEKAGKAIVEAGQRQSALMNKAFDPTGKTLIRDPQAANQAAMNLLEGPLGFMPAGITAWHGSPHTFEKFDASKIDSGHGAQVYGQGMYFAESPDIAKAYKVTVGKQPSIGENIQTLVNNEPITDELIKKMGGDEITSTVLNKINQIGGRSAYSEAYQELSKLPNSKPYLDKLKEFKNSISTENVSGNLYKVDIPDEYIPKMLNWDKPLADQPKEVQDLAWKYKDALVNATKMTGDKSIWDLDGAQLYGVMQRYSPTEKGKVVKKQIDAGEVAKIFNQSGVPGIEYMNYQNIKGKGAGTSNYVVFDPKDVKILERNNQPMTRKEVIEEQVNKLK